MTFRVVKFLIRVWSRSLLRYEVEAREKWGGTNPTLLVRSQQQNTRILGVVPVSVLLILNRFHTLF